MAFSIHTLTNYTFISIELSISLFICISCLLIHFSQHFRLQCCNRHYTKPELDIRQSIAKLSNKLSNNPATLTPPSIPNEPPQFTLRKSSIFSRETLKHPEDAIQWCLRPIDNEQFDFFPRSFLWYQLFLVCLLTLTLIRFILLMNSNKLINNININNRLHILDWIIIYCILLLINWECLFAFYRYYSTYYSAKFFDSIDNIIVFKLFAKYCIVFVLLLIAQIHFYFWIFVIIIPAISFLVLFCTWKTSNILIGQCKQMELMMEDFGNNGGMQSSMRKSIYFMRNSSIISSICCIIYLSLFLIIYNINIIFYLPVLWSIITIAFTLNFIRNRQFLYKIFSKLILTITTLNRPKRLHLTEVKSRSNYNKQEMSPTTDTPIPNANNNNNTTEQPKNYKLQIDNGTEITQQNSSPTTENNDTPKPNLPKPYPIKHTETVTLSVEPQSSNTHTKHEKNPSKTMTKTAIVHSSIDQKMNGPEFGLDVLYDINDEEIICDDDSNNSSDNGNMIMITEGMPFEFQDENYDVYASNPVTREPSPFNSPLTQSPRVSNRLSNSNKLSNSKRIHKLANKIKPKISNSSHKNKSNSKSLGKHSSNSKPHSTNYTAPVNRLDSHRKRKILNVRNKWKNRFKKFANKNKNENRKNTTTKFGKSQSTKTTNTAANHLKPHTNHRRIQSEKPSINNIQTHSNPLPTNNIHSPSNSQMNDVPKIGINYSEPVRTNNVQTTVKQSNHIQSLSYQIGDNKLKNINDKNEKSRRTLSRKLMFDKLPNKMQRLSDIQKKKVEEFANLHLCMSLHGFCEKDSFFQFDVAQNIFP